VCHGSSEVKRVQQTIFGRFVNVQPCDRCGGKGTVVAIPANCGRGKARVTRAGQDRLAWTRAQMRLAGERMGLMGGPPGNLFVVLQVRRHKMFHREHNDILLD
jgi:molecular chaperone DnaJ